MSEEAKSINKSAIKSFAIEARNILIKSATTEAGLYGISEDEIRTPIQKGPDFEVYETLAGTEKRIYRADMRRRENLVKAIQEKGFQEVIEKTAYTWFNRLIAIRFMEVNDYLPTRTRVLSSETGNNTPDLINDFLDVDLGMTDEELQAVQTAKNENRYDDAFRLLFIKECNALNDILPGLFKKTDDYMELLLNMPYTSDGVVRMLIDTIPEKNFDVEKEGQIEIIGWLYQYYNTKPKAKAFGKKGKITKEEIPAVTQLFTPDWIVRYMVENSLGRLWLDGHQDDELKNQWIYYLDEARQEIDVEHTIEEYRKKSEKLSPEEIKVIDPCMGSGHILVYLFEVLMHIYKHEGYTERDAAELIIRNNLYGLDIDDRAYQLSYFAVMMKARQYNRNILKSKIECNIYSIKESNSINTHQLGYFGAGLVDGEKEEANRQILKLISVFFDAKEYGSMLNMPMLDWDLLDRYMDLYDIENQINLDTIGIDQTQKDIKKLIRIGRVMSNKYSVTITNPPYAAVKGINSKADDYIKKNYPDSKADLFAVFIEQCINFTEIDGFCSMVTPQAWMFLVAFDKLRTRILDNCSISTLLQFGMGAFDCGFGTAAYVIRRRYIDNWNGLYINLTDTKDTDEKEKNYLKKDKEIVFVQNQSLCRKLPNSVIAYWCSKKFEKIYSELPSIKEEFSLECGIKNGKNEMFLRPWFSVSLEKVNSGDDRQKCLSNLEHGKKWFKCNKGGGYKKWYGNYEYVINLENDAHDIKSLVSASTYRLRKKENYFWPTITWPLSGGDRFSCRYMQMDALPDVNANIIILRDTKTYTLMGYMNSVVFDKVLNMLNPTLNFPIDTIGSSPYKPLEDEKVEKLVKENIEICKRVWDSTEKSWDFRRNELLCGKGSIEEAYESMQRQRDTDYSTLKSNEELLNSIFIEYYGLDDELSSKVEDPNMSISKCNKREEIVKFISYAVGCMFGRYSLKEEGIILAGGTLQKDRYSEFLPDVDGIIPITDEEYLNDDIVSLFVKFVRITFGNASLESNLQYIAEALEMPGNTPREVLRNYFLNKFYEDHCSIFNATGYGKSPIYWMFDSGKQNGFKALIYIHRYNPDTVGLIRSTYLHKVQAAIENSLQNAEYVISTSSSATEKAAASKKRDKYVKQLNELRPYYQALSHVALKRIDMDLDDGVKANYQLFQGVEISTEGKKKQKIDLLAKI